MLLYHCFIHVLLMFLIIVIPYSYLLTFSGLLNPLDRVYVILIIQLFYRMIKILSKVLCVCVSQLCFFWARLLTQGSPSNHSCTFLLVIILKLCLKNLTAYRMAIIDIFLCGLKCRFY